MPNRSQIFKAGISVHIVLRSNNSRPCFYAAEDYRYYLHSLLNHTATFSCALHAYVLMSNHVHLLLTPAHEKSVITLIEQLGELYNQYFNRTYRECGSSLGKRFNCYLIHEEEALLDCQRYIELNPVRNGVVTHPGEYPWSSYRANAHGVNSNSLTPHPSYLLLGNSKSQRMVTYRDLFLQSVDHKRRNSISGAGRSGNSFDS